MNAYTSNGIATFLAEPDEIVELFDGVIHDTTHRTRPVKNEDQSVVLTIVDRGDFLEEIFVVLVGMKFSAVKSTSTTTSCTNICIVTDLRHSNSLPYS